MIRSTVLKKGLRILSALLVVVIALVVSVAGFEYLKVAFSPIYDDQEMQLSYEVLGEGEQNLVLIHGLAGSRNYWKRELDALGQSHRIILIDLLGFGDSPKPQSSYSLEVQMKAVEKILRAEHVVKDQAYLVGHSLGSIVSLALLADEPIWFEGAVLIGLPVFTSEEQFIEDSKSFSAFDRLAVSSYGKLVCMLRPLYMLPWFRPEGLPKDVFEDARKHTWQSYYNSFNEVVLRTDLYALTNHIENKRVLFIHGALDKPAPFANARAFASTFTNMEFEEWPTGDHQLFLQDPAKVWRSIHEFIEQDIDS